MVHGDLPFNWAQVRSYIEGSEFKHTRDVLQPPQETEHECLIAIPTVDAMRDIRYWLHNHFESPYEKFGHFILSVKDGLLVSRCIGVRFVFKTAMDLNFFRVSCHSGHPVYED
jgi:hypothetical protein